jgi:DNA-binding transcriptional LysR family regulator
MDHIKQIEALVNSATRGSLSAAAQAEGVTPAVIGRRLDALEARLGVKLLLRTTRKLSLTFEGQAFLEDCQRILNDLANAEAAVSLGGIRASGHLRVSAPAGFGRRHVAPQVAVFMAANPEVSVRLDLTDRLVDLVNEGVDCAVRIGEMADSSLASSNWAKCNGWWSPARLISRVAGPPGRPPNSQLTTVFHSASSGGGRCARRRPERSPTARCRAPSSATMARCCMNGPSPAKDSPGDRGGKSAMICTAVSLSPCLTIMPRRPSAFTPFSPNAVTCHYAFACSSISSRRLSAIRNTGKPAAEQTASPVLVARFPGFPQLGSPQFFGLDVREGLRLVAFLAIGVQASSRLKSSTSTASICSGCMNRSGVRRDRPRSAGKVVACLQGKSGTFADRCAAPVASR